MINILSTTSTNFKPWLIPFTQSANLNSLESSSIGIEAFWEVSYDATRMQAGYFAVTSVRQNFAWVLLMIEYKDSSQPISTLRYIPLTCWPFLRDDKHEQSNWHTDLIVCKPRAYGGGVTVSGEVKQRLRQLYIGYKINLVVNKRLLLWPCPSTSHQQKTPLTRYWSML